MVEMIQVETAQKRRGAEPATVKLDRVIAKFNERKAILEKTDLEEEVINQIMALDIAEIEALRLTIQKANEAVFVRASNKCKFLLRELMKEAFIRNDMPNAPKLVLDATKVMIREFRADVFGIKDPNEIDDPSDEDVDEAEANEPAQASEDNDAEVEEANGHDEAEPIEASTQAEDNAKNLGKHYPKGKKGKKNKKK